MSFTSEIFSYEKNDSLLTNNVETPSMPPAEPLSHISVYAMPWIIF